MKKKSETIKKDADRIKEENEIIKKQNQQLVTDLSNNIQDPIKQLQAKRYNEEALKDGKQLNPIQLKDRLKATESQLITQKQEFEGI